jgi:signal transduction histidine kinase
LVRLESGFALNIIDDGGGAAADHKVGMGLANMRQRSASLPGGRFEFSSRPGGGASVTVTWLLSNESNL